MFFVVFYFFSALTKSFIIKFLLSGLKSLVDLQWRRTLVQRIIGELGLCYRLRYRNLQ